MGLFSSQLTLKQLVPLCRQWATAHDAGIPMLASLELLQRRLRSKHMRGIISRLEDQIKDGNTLAGALRSESRYFPPLMIESIHAGEVGGQLDKVLRDLAQYFEDRREMFMRMLGMFIYPIFLLIAAWFLGTFALKLISESGGSGFSFDDFLVGYFWFQVKWMCVFAAMFGVIVILARVGIWQWIWGAFSTFVWPVSPITKRLAMARYCRCLALLIQAGVPITQALQRSAGAAGNPYIERDLLQTIPPVREGATLTQAFEGSRYMPITAKHMLEVGEESGNMEIQLQKVSEWYMQEAEVAMKFLTTALYFAVYIGVAFVVLLILLSFYGSYFNRLGL